MVHCKLDQNYLDVLNRFYFYPNPFPFISRDSICCRITLVTT